MQGEVISNGEGLSRRSLGTPENWDTHDQKAGPEATLTLRYDLAYKEVAFLSVAPGLSGGLHLCGSSPVNRAVSSPW